MVGAGKKRGKTWWFMAGNVTGFLLCVWMHNAEAIAAALRNAG